MQKATITIVVESGKDNFAPNETEIFKKAMAKLKKGEYTADIEDIN